MNHLKCCPRLMTGMLVIVFLFSGCDSPTPSAGNGDSENRASENAANDNDSKNSSQNVQAISLSGRELVSRKPNPKLVKKFEQYQTDYLANPEDPDRLIWYGRFTAYLGEYQQAIALFSKGIEQFPEDPRFLRHRGHRLITIRKFDEAIADLSKAGQMIGGTIDKIEPDGMPNSKNIPVSSLHTNIWYHLGLAYYLKNQLVDAAKAYEAGLAACQNDDMRVAFTHWAYMTYRQLGDREKAAQWLDGIKAEMNVIESFDYHKLCLLYQGSKTVEQIERQQTPQSNGSSEALLYGIANWHLYNGNRELAERLMLELAGAESWASFGCIAAEATCVREFSNER